VLRDREVVVEEEVKGYLESCFRLKSRIEDPPKITLQLMSRVPPGEADVGALDVAVTTAFQCYAPGIAIMKERVDEKSESVAKGTLEAGHHTTRQHVYYTFRLEGVTRSVVHDVLHGNPFYNSEQQSQRYVEARAGNYFIPADLTLDQREIYINAAEFTNGLYFDLLHVLQPVISERIHRMYPEAGWKVGKTAERLNSKIIKTSQEIARYVLPIGQKTNLYHTLNELQLLRLFRASKMGSFSDEARYLVSEMIRRVSDVDPTILRELDVPLDDLGEANISEEYIREQKRDFDQLLGDSETVLIGFPDNAGEILANSTRNTLGLPMNVLNDREALNRLMNPANNQYLSDVYDIGMMDSLTSSLRQVGITFASKFSHTGDSQRQRQRRTAGATPSIEALYDGSPDYITPLVISEDEKLREYYQEMVGRIYENVKRAIDAGIPRKEALLLLPNAHAVRVFETGDLFDWLHRWKQRLCYLAQEEIFFVSLKQVQEVAKVLPESELMLLAPCGLRQKSGVRPRCPEGERWCGKPVFNWTLEKYKEGRLV
jgi:thymidylate synthase ThyX